MTRPLHMIDIFCHILPEKYKKALYSKSRNSPYLKDMEGTSRIFPALSDLQFRLKMLERLQGMKQVLTIVYPSAEILSPENTVELSRIANEEMAELVARHPEYFIAGVACLPLNDIDASLREAERAIEDLKLKGIQLFTPCAGKPLDSPEFFPLYEMMVKYDLPVWLHPSRVSAVPDYEGEAESRYRVFISIGWPYETTVGMVRLVRGGVLEKFPALKVITHHLGGMTPYFIYRMKWRPEPGGPGMELKQSPVAYFKMFYADTVVGDNLPALMCGHAFFGTEHVLFASDIPSPVDYREKIAPIEKLPVAEAEKSLIFEGNARRLLHL